MPGMDGLETAALIRSRERSRFTPIIFLTAFDRTNEQLVRGYRLGAVDFLSKPIHPPEILKGKVGFFIDLHRKSVEIRRQWELLRAAENREHARNVEEIRTRLEADALRREMERERELSQVLQRANRQLEEMGQERAKLIEELQHQAAELRDSDRRKDEFLAVLAHELRNPLAPIRYAVEVMSRASADAAANAWSREVIERQVLHLTELVDDLLDISRITRGTINLNIERLEVSTIVGRAVEAIEPALVEHQQQLSVDCPPEPMFVEGDVTRLVQVLGNLLSNAVKYSKPGGRIEFDVRRGERGVEFVVRDFGVGIPAESLPRLFTLFSRLPGGHPEAQAGLGVGLALVRRLVEMHGGSVSAHSDGANQGSEFVVRLPACAGAAAGPPGTARAPEQQRDSGGRILVADDNPDALDGLSLLLQASGYEVLKACDGLQALQIAADSHPHLALLDLGMPQMDGYEVARRIRAEPWGGEVALVALSGWGQSEDLRRTHESGFDFHLVKPVSFEAVSDVIARFVRRADAADA
jgi:signal transduction histidine kinase